MSDVDTCLICGEPVPEGIHVCPTCEKEAVLKKDDSENRYSSYIYRGDVFFADLNPVVGSEIGGIRPVVILQNNIGNKYSTTLIAAVTSRARRHLLPTHVKLGIPTGGLTEDTTVLLEQLRTIDKRRLKQFIGHMDEDTMKRIDKAAVRSMGLQDAFAVEGDRDDDI